MKQNWRRHPVYSDYEVSDAGNVRRVTTKRGAVAGRVLKPGKTKQGYRHVVIDGAARRVYALVLETFIAPRPKNAEARHLNNRKDDDRLANLAWGTHAQNYADRVAAGGGNHGSRHGLAILSENQVVEIRRRYIPRVVTQRALAREFKVSRECITAAVNGKRWRHI